MTTVGGRPGSAGESARPPGPGQPKRVGARAGVELSGRFLQVVGQKTAASGLTPSVLCRSAVEVLPVDAAGLSTLVDALRIPLGASSAAAETAEEIQTSLGVGPCLEVAETQVAIVADLADLAERWPLYGSEMAGKTPFRSAGSVPLRNAEGAVFAALDLYADAPDLSARLDLVAVGRDVAPVVAALLWPRVAEIAAAEEVQPTWYASASARRRKVWVAVGMVMGELRCSQHDALGRLRAYAYSHDTTLDRLAEQLTDNQVLVNELTH